MTSAWPERARPVPLIWLKAAHRLCLTITRGQPQSRVRYLVLHLVLLPSPTSTATESFRFAMQPDLLSGFIVAAKKRSRSKGARAKRAVPAVWHFSIVLSTAARSLVNMTVTAVTSGAVLLCLFAVKRFL